MDAFAVSIGKGLSLRAKSTRYGLLCGLWFGAFQALMPLIGYFAGSRFSGFVESIDHWIVFILLVLIGGNMIREAINERASGETAPPDPSFGFATMLALAIATSIDALAAGISFALMHVALIASVTIIGCTTFVLSFAGVVIGYKTGKLLEKRAQVLGGIILIAIGFKILFEHTGILG